MNALTIANTSIRQDAEGRYSLNDLHRAAGGEDRHSPRRWVQNQQTEELIAELQTDGISSVSPLATLEGRNGGTYAVKELVYAYAMWVSPAFHLRVIRTFDALTAAKAAGEPVKTASDALKLATPTFRFARALGLDKNAAAISANNLVYKLTHFKLLEAMGQTHLIATNQTSLWFTPTDLGKRFGIKGCDFNRLLAESGLQIKYGDVWAPTEAAEGLYRLFDTGKQHHNGTPVTQIKWAETVLKRLKLFKEIAA
jgi:hypothetical protein